MSELKYNNIKLVPSPQISISRALTQQGNDAEISRSFNISLEGDLIPQAGGNSYITNTTDPAHYMDVVFRKANALREAFSTTGQSLQVLDNSGIMVLGFRPYNISIDFPTNIYTQDVKYAINCQAYSISSCVTDGANPSYAVNSGLYQLKSATDEFSYTMNDNSIDVSRSINAQGQGDGTDRLLAFTRASSWCESHYEDVSWYDPIKSFMNKSFGDETNINPSSAMRSINKNYSKENGTYAIIATYQLPRNSGDFIESLNVQSAQADDDFITMSVGYNVMGLGSTISDRIASIQSAFNSTSTTNICSSIFNKAKSYVPILYPMGNASFEVISFDGSLNRNEGTAAYNVGYRVTKVNHPLVASGLGFWGIQGSVSFDQKTAKFQISANGSLNKTATSKQFAVPSYGVIMDYFAGKGIIPSTWKSKSALVNVSKNYAQDNSLYGWTLQIEGNAVVGLTATPILIDRNLSHNIIPNQWKEDINENTVISLGTSLFDANTFTMVTIPQLLHTTKNDFIGCAAYTLPTSTYFASPRSPVMTACGVNSFSLADGTIYQYQVSRNFSVCPYDLANYVPSSIPIENVQISVQRNYDTLVTRSAQIPGRKYGPIFQNLKTYTTPTISISIQLTLGRKLSTGLLSIAGNYQPSVNESFMFDNNATGANTFINGINLQGMSDAILRSIIGQALKIDREINDFSIDGAAAIVTGENDNYNPIGGSYQYACQYSLVNLGYRS